LLLTTRSSRSGADLDCSRHAEDVVVRQAGVAVGAGHGESVPPDLAALDLAGAEGLCPYGQCYLLGIMDPGGVASDDVGGDRGVAPLDRAADGNADSLGPEGEGVGLSTTAATLAGSGA
jgi:hypothetical protein